MKTTEQQTINKTFSFVTKYQLECANIANYHENTVIMSAVFNESRILTEENRMMIQQVAFQACNTL